MTTGISVTTNLMAGQGQTIYTVPSDTTFTGNIRLTNRNQDPVKVRIAIFKGLEPNDADYIEYDATVPGTEPLEDTGLIIIAGEKVYVWASINGVSVRIHGIEENL